MTNESTISDLRAAIQRLEAEKREIEKQHRALVTTLRYFENPEQASAPESRRIDKDMGTVMSEILSREGPLHRREIHDRLVEIGVRIGGRTPINNVGARLSTDSRFKNVGRGMWDLASATGGRGESLGAGRSAESGDVGGTVESGHDPDEPEEDEPEEEDSVAW